MQNCCATAVFYDIWHILNVIFKNVHTIITTTDYRLLQVI